MYHPSRGGVRGGRDQFNWDDVKGDKHRENYLGHSVKAPVGRWQKGKDLYWYTKDHGADGASKEEIKRIQEEEEDAMKEMLGLAPRKKKRPQGNQLDKREVDELFKKGKTEEDLPASYVNAERIQGLGFAPAPGQTSGQPGVKQAGQTPRNDNIDINTEHVTQGAHEKGGKRDVADGAGAAPEPPISSAAKSNKQDVDAVNSDDEAASRKKKKEEKRKAKELRREAKRTRKKVLKDDSGNRREGRRNSRERREDRSRTKPDNDSTISEFHNRDRKEESRKARHDSEDSDSSDGNIGRLTSRNSGSSKLRSKSSHERTGRRRNDHGSPSDDDSPKHRKREMGVESPDYSGHKSRRQEGNHERKRGNSYPSSDDSTIIKRHKRERREQSPIRSYQKQRRHDSDDEGNAHSCREEQRRR